MKQSYNKQGMKIPLVLWP